MGPHNELLLRAFDSSSTAMSLTDADGRVVDANQRFWELFGSHPDAELDVSMLTRPDDRAWTMGYVRQLVDGELDEFDTDKRFVRLDGTEFDAHLTVRSLRGEGEASNEFIGMIASIDPITPRPKVGDARVRKLLEHAAGTLTLVDADGRVLETSGRYRSTMGYPPEFWEQRTIFDVVVPGEVERVLDMRRQVLSEPNRQVSGDFHVIAADHHIETLEVIAVNLLHDPDVEGIVVSSRNVTEERANTRAISLLRDEAVSEATRRSRLLATVSHELRNPLHAMAGLAELLASEVGLPPAQYQLAATLQRQLLRLSKITDDLLDTARLDSGEFRLRPTVVDIRRLVDDARMAAEALVGPRLQITSTVSDEVPFALVADPGRLQQIVDNLVGNAIKFTDRGTVELDVGTDDGRLVIVVTDTGPGIPPESREQIFEAFATLPVGGDRSGAGLGLAIVRRLVDSMDGTLELDSEVGVGTRFRVSVPLVETRRADDEPIVTTARGRVAAPRRVLVVEDTPVNQDLARAQLERIGATSVIVDNAEEAIDLLEIETFDAVLMDHMLPGMNGLDATRLIRSRGWNLPIIGVTASSTAADAQACFHAGMNAYLPKPVGLEQLRLALEEIWQRADGDAVTDQATDQVTGHVTDPAPHSGSGSAPDAGPSGRSNGPAVDAAVLQALVDDLDERSIVERLVRSFLDELDVRVADICGGDVSLAARQAHTLKSTAAMVGATDLAAACASLDTDNDPESRAQVAVLADSARSELLQWLDHEHDD